MDELGDEIVRYSVSVFRPGPLRLRLRLDGSGQFASVMGFEQAGADEGLSELLCDGRVEENDILESINGVSLLGRSLDDILLQVSRVSREHSTRILTFRKPDVWRNTQQEAEKPPQPPIPRQPPSSSSAAASTQQQKSQQLRGLLKESLINEGRLRNLASQGLPDEGGLRGVIWRLLLRYLPLETDLWPQHLAAQRKEYQEAIHRYIQTTALSNFFPTPGDGCAAKPIVGTTRVNVEDDPLRTTDDAAWATYLADTVLMEEIQKDVVRTHPDISFFNTDPQGTCQAVMQRILFIYAKLHPTVRYVQGMNELCGTLYYVFASGDSEEWLEHAEADTFHCFSLLVMEMQDMFIRQKDASDSGIIARIKQFTDLVEMHDPELHSLLDQQGIDSAFYGLRWLTTILSREFNLPDTIRLWDTLFSDTNRDEFLSYICCTMILEQREKLLKGDFAENLGLLQAYPESDINVLISTATSLRSKDFSKRARNKNGIEDSDTSFEGDTSQQRFLASIKSGLKTAAGHAAVVANTSLSEIKSKGSTLLKNSRDSVAERLRGAGNWLAAALADSDDDEPSSRGL